MKSLVNFRLATFSAIGLIAGILFSYCLICGKVFGAVCSAVAAALVFIIFTYFSSAKFKSAGRVLCFLIFIVCLCIGGFGFKIAAENYKNADLNGHILNVSGKIVEISEGENYSRLIIDDVNFAGAISGKSYYKTEVRFYGDNVFRIGDVVGFTAAVKDRTLVYNGNFSASALVERIKYFAETDAAGIVKIASSPNVFEKCNLFIFDTLKAGLKENEFPIAYAMLTGNSDFMEEENINAYRDAGVAHIFAVSGLHIGFLATALYFVLNKLKVKRWIAFAITLLCCVFYAGICEFSASSVRAVIMFFFLNFASLLGLKYDSVSSVSAAAFIILAISPAQLFCVGFLLSFAVVFTVLVLYNPLIKLLKFLPKKLAAPIAVSFAAEIGGAPILLYFFGKFASLSLFINILFIPVAGIIFVALIVCTVLGGIFSPAVVLFVPEYALFALNYIITTLDFKIFLIGGFTFGGFAASYYGEIVLAGGLVNLKKAVKISLCVLLAILTVAGTWAQNYIKSERTFVAVMGSENLSAAIFSVKDENVLVISDISYRRFFEYRLSELLKKASGEKIAIVLLKQDKTVDLTAMTVKLRYVAESMGVQADRLYYYGERDENAENAMSALFADFTSKNMQDGDAITVYNGKFTFTLGGRCLVYTVNGHNTGVFSSFIIDGESAYSDIELQTAICFDKAEGIESVFSPKKTVSFRAKSGYIDGETAGYLTLSIG